MDREQRKNRRNTVRTCVALALVAIIVISVAVIARKTRISGYFDGVKAGEPFYYDASGNAAFGGVGEYLAVLSAMDLTVYDKEGRTVFTEYCHVSSPAIVSAGNYAAAYDIGGEWVCLFGEKGVVKTIQSEYPVISAEVSEKGMLAVCTESSGYYGAVEVYGADGEIIYRWRSGNGYVLTAQPEANEFYALALGKGGSKAVRYEYDSTDEQARYETDALVIDLLPEEKGVCAVMESGLVFLDKNGEERARFDVGGVTERYAHGDGFTVIVTGEYKTSTTREISVINSDGEKTASIPAEDEVTDISAAGDYIAVLYKSKAVLYTADLTVINEITELSGENSIVLNKNGNMFTAGIYSATGHIKPQE